MKKAMSLQTKIYSLLLAISVSASAQTNAIKFSQEPTTNAATLDDDLLLNATNATTGGYNTRRINVRNFMNSVTSNTWSGSFVGNGGGLTNILGQSGFTYAIEQFGGVGDGRLLRTVWSTNSSYQVACFDANWTSADIGKKVVLYLNLTNNAYLLTSIVSVEDSNHITMSDICTKTWAGVGTMRYGTDNTTAIQTALNLMDVAGGRLLFSNGCYFVSGNAQSNGLREVSVLHIPATPVSDAATSQKTIELIGSLEPLKAYNNQSGGPSEEGTVLFCPTRLPAAFDTNNCFSLIANNAATLAWPLENTFYRRLTFRAPWGSPISMLDHSHSGGLNVFDCAFDHDFPVGFIASAQVLTAGGVHDATTFMPLGPFIGTTPNPSNVCSRAIICPVQSNTSDTKVGRVHIFGYGSGIQANEHLDFTSSEIHWCNVGIEVGDPLNGTLAAGCHTFGIQILGCQYAIAATPTATLGQLHIEFRGIYPEVYTNQIYQLYDPNDGLFGILSVLNPNVPRPNPYLIVEDLWHGNVAYRGPVIIGGPFGGYGGISFVTSSFTNYGGWYPYASIMGDGTDTYLQPCSPGGFLFMKEQNGNGTALGVVPNGGLLVGDDTFIRGNLSPVVGDVKIQKTLTVGSITNDGGTIQFGDEIQGRGGFWHFDNLGHLDLGNWRSPSNAPAIGDVLQAKDVLGNTVWTNSPWLHLDNVWTQTNTFQGGVVLQGYVGNGNTNITFTSGIQGYGGFWDIYTNGVGIFQQSVMIPTNTAPTSVTVGTTAPDRWLRFADLQGNFWYVPAWTNH